MQKLVWKFQTNRTKNEEVIAYTIWVVRRDRVQSVQPAGRQAREGREWGNGPMYWFFSLVSSLMLLLRSVCHVICKGNGYAWRAHLSNIRDFIEVGCEICTPPAWSDLALPSDNSKVDCAGGKFKNSSLNI